MAERSTPRGPGRLRLLFWVATGIAVTPYAVSAITVATSARGYRTIGDLALTELYVRDVGAHAVLLGPPSRYGWFHPGPALFYLLAVPFRILGERSVALLVGAAAINALCVVGIALVARRVGGARFAIATLAVTALLGRALGAMIGRSPWNPYVTILPLVLFVLGAWAVARARVWALPLVAGVGTFVVQSHIGYLPVVAAVLVAGLVGLVTESARAVRRVGQPFPAGRFAGAALATFGILAVLWLPPAYQQITGRHGNLGELVRYFTEPHRGQTVGEGVRVVFHQVAIAPPWLTGHWPAAQAFTAQIDAGGSPAVPAVGLALVAGLALAAWRRDRDAAWLAGIVLVGLGASIASVARIVGPVIQYLTMFAPVLGALAALAALWALGRALPAPWRARAAPPATALAFAALLFGAIGLSVSSADPARVQDSPNNLRLVAIEGPLLDAGRSFSGPVEVASSGDYFFAPGGVAFLVAHGIDARLWPLAVGPARFEHRRGSVVGKIDLAASSDVSALAAVPGCRFVGGSQGPAAVQAHRALSTRELASLLTEQFGPRAVTAFRALSPEAQARVVAVLSAVGPAPAPAFGVVACATPTP